MEERKKAPGNAEVATQLTYPQKTRLDSQVHSATCHPLSTGIAEAGVHRCSLIGGPAGLGGEEDRERHEIMVKGSLLNVHRLCSLQPVGGYTDL